MKTRVTTGYSGTPLVKKLGIKEASRVLLLDASDDFKQLLAPLPPDVRFESRSGPNIDIAHIFVTRKEELTAISQGGLDSWFWAGIRFFDWAADLRLRFQFLGVGRKRGRPTRDCESVGSRDSRRFD